MDEIELIGGPADGTVLNVEDQTLVIRVPILIPEDREEMRTIVHVYCRTGTYTAHHAGTDSDESGS